MKPKDARSLFKKNPRQKYGATRAQFAGRSFHSKAEATVAAHLELLKKAGEISEIKYQVQVDLTDARVIYKPDFLVFDLVRNEWIYWECKGFETPEWRIKRRLWSVYGPGPLKVVEVRYGRVIEKEEIIPKQNK